MACSGCERRRAWLKKWMAIAYERATSKRAAGNNERSDSSDKSPGGVK